jgi:hypothetical protein
LASDKPNARLLEIYKELVKDKNIKKIPKFVAEFRNAKYNFLTHFLPKIVCYDYSFFSFIISFILSINILDNSFRWLF